MLEFVGCLLKRGMLVEDKGCSLYFKRLCDDGKRLL